MKLLQCLLYKNRCYKAGATMTPTKIVVHSTGANNTDLCRYVQPHDGQTSGMGEIKPNKKSYTAAEMIALLGKNRYANDWNRECDGDGSRLRKCVNALIGTMADGSVATVQTLPWAVKPWGVGAGKNGTYNDCAIQFEICEDNLKDAAYCKATFEEAAQLCAHLMRSYPTITEIVSHKEAALRGYGSNHGDPEHWWPKHGLSMDKFRARVNDLLNEKVEGEEEMVKFNTLEEVPAYGQETVKKLMDCGALKGDKSGNLNLSEDMLRTFVILDRMGKL